jgi:hypothetical protein
MSVSEAQIQKSLAPRVRGESAAPRALILLAGSLRANHLGAGLRRSILDLPLLAGDSVLRQWCRQAGTLEQAPGSGPLSVRVLLDPTAPEPATMAGDPSVALRIERDRFDFRGSGGVLHDISHAYADDDRIIVGNAAAVLLEPLAPIVAALCACDADIAIHAQADNTPSGLMLVRCGCLREISEVGFVDMKEQALPAIAARNAVTVVHRSIECYAIRSLADYLGVLREQVRWGKSVAGASPEGAAPRDPFDEDWQPRFGIVEDPATVDPSARIHDAVVLSGARVQANAVVVRSVVGRGGVVRRGQMVVDQIVGPTPDRR